MAEQCNLNFLGLNTIKGVNPGGGGDGEDVFPTCFDMGVITCLLSPPPCFDPQICCFFVYIALECEVQCIPHSGSGTKVKTIMLKSWRSANHTPPLLLA